VKPYLFDFLINDHRIRLPSFGIFLASAFSVAYFLSLKNAQKLKIETKHIERLFLLILISSVFGGRLFHVFFEEPSYYWHHPLRIIAVWEGGFTFYGAMLSSVAAIFWYCRMNQLGFLNLLDVISTSTLLSVSIGRVGCFLAGCCWGKTCSLPWAVSFEGASVHPAQLYESIGAFFLFVFCQRHLFKRDFIGSVGLKALLGYSILRFIVEFFRGDTYRGFILNGLLSYSQLISLIVGVSALTFLVTLTPKKNS